MTITSDTWQQQYNMQQLNYRMAQFQTRRRRQQQPRKSNSPHVPKGNSNSPQVLKELPCFKDPAAIHSISYPHNVITKIRPSIGLALSLSSVNLAYNQISNIEPLFQLFNLRVLNLSYNRVSTISKGMGKMGRLDTVDLCYNLVETVQRVGGLVELWGVRRGKVGIMLEGNPVIKLEHQVIEQVFRAYPDQVRHKHIDQDGQEDIHKNGQEDICKNKHEHIYKNGHEDIYKNGHRHIDQDVSMILPVFASWELLNESAGVKKQDKSRSLLLETSNSECLTRKFRHSANNMTHADKEGKNKPRDKENRSYQNSLEMLDKLKHKQKSNLNVSERLNRQTDGFNTSEGSMQVSNANKIDEIKQKMEILSSACCSKWDTPLTLLLRQQVEVVNIYIRLHQDILVDCNTYNMETDLEVAKDELEDNVAQSEELKALLKNTHKQLLDSLQDSRETPIQAYRIWVNLLRDLQRACGEIVRDGWAHLINLSRRRQILEMLKLSPEKAQSAKKSSPELENLLFSSKKGQGEEGKTTPAKENYKGKAHECDSCFIKDEQMARTRQSMESLLAENEGQKQHIQQLKETLRQSEDRLGRAQGQIKRAGMDNLNIKQKQKQIISRLEDKVDASVYQEVLLMQAKGIEGLLRGSGEMLEFHSPAMLGADMLKTQTVKQARISYFAHQSNSKSKSAHMHAGNQGDRLNTYESNDCTPSPHMFKGLHTSDNSSAYRDRSLQGRDARAKDQKYITQPSAVLAQRKSSTKTPDNGKDSTAMGRGSKVLSKESAEMGKESTGMGKESTGMGKESSRMGNASTGVKKEMSKKEEGRVGSGKSREGQMGCTRIEQEKEKDEKDMIVVSDFAVLTENMEGQAGKGTPAQTWEPTSVTSYVAAEHTSNKELYSQYISQHLRNEIIQTLSHKGRGITKDKKQASLKGSSLPKRGPAAGELRRSELMRTVDLSRSELLRGKNRYMSVKTLKPKYIKV